MSKKYNVWIVAISLFVIAIIFLGWQNFPAKANTVISDTPDINQIIAVMNQAYDLLGKASQSLDTSEFPSVFIDTDDYILTPEQQEIVSETLSLDVAQVKSAGYLTSMQAKYISKARGNKLLQTALIKARAENRKLTADEIQEIVKANHGQWPSGNPVTGKTKLTFESIEINGDKAVVRYDDGAALQEAILVKKEGRWFIASIVPIWIHF